MPHKGRIYFGLRGSFDPDKATALIGLTPTKIARKGEREPGKLPKCSHWDFSLSGQSCYDIDVYELASQLISHLEPKKREILKAIEQWSLESKLQVVLDYDCSEESASTVAIGFDASVIRFLAEIGAYIDVDTYL